MTSSVIYLGDVSSRRGDQGGYPGGHRGHGRIRVGRVPRVLIAVLAVLLLGGSGPGEPPVVRQVWWIPSASAEWMTVDDDSVYVFRRDERISLTAYDLRTGSVRWQRDPGDGPGWLGVTLRHGVLLLPGEEQAIDVKSPGSGIVSFSYAGSTTALDPATGRQLWKISGELHRDDTGENALVSEHADDGDVTRIRQIRLRDGSVVWERPTREVTDILVVPPDGAERGRVVTATAQGALTVLDYSDGTPVVSGSVPWRRRSAETGAGSNLTSVPGRFVIVDTGLGVAGDQSRITVYRAGDLTPLWSRDTAGWASIQDCGPLICLNTDRNRYEAVDPDTGEKRWDIEGGWLTGPLPEGDRLIVADAGDEPRQTLVDTATGRVIGAGGRGSLLSLDEKEGSALLLRSLDSARTVVSRLDTGTGQGTVLGVFRAGGEISCDGHGRWIVCASPDRLVAATVG